MTSTREIGMRHEREMEEFLLNKGHLAVQRVKGSTKFNTNCDFFGLFDLISFDQDWWYLVQVKTQFLNKVKNEIQDWMTEKCPPNTIAIYAVRKKKVPKDKRWTLHIIVPVVKEGEQREEPTEYPTEIKEMAEKLQ